jgi:cytoskeletal protein CcmA (bactofilin family)
MGFSSTISATTLVRGNVSGEGSLEILGRVEGDIAVTGDVSLAAGAQVNGTISGARVHVHGSVQGDVTASESIVLEESASVLGDLSAPRLAVAEGATVQGTVRVEGGAGARIRRIEREPGESAGGVVTPLAVVRPVEVARDASHRRPPPPVVNAPRNGRARKKVARR